MIYMLMAVVFVLGYLAIALEHNIHIDKAASALLTAALVWTLLVFGADVLLSSHLAEAGAHAAGAAGGHGGTSQFLNTELRHHLAEIAEILFFLMGAMTIVELIDAHDGFAAITNRIQTTNAATLLWIIGFLTFFLSALLDNLTTTIVMVSLLRKLVSDKETRWLFVGMVVIAANAGGAWSPIGDVTTTMLWIGHQISASSIIVNIIVPSVVAAVVPIAFLTLKLKGKTITRPVLNANVGGHASGVSSHGNSVNKEAGELPITPATRLTVLFLGLGALAFVPVFKTVTHLPPYMGILFGLSLLWIYTEINHRNQHKEIKQQLTVIGVLSKIDMPSILFFLGILLAVSGLATAGHLTDMAQWLDTTFGNLYVINVLIGLLSSLVDNVPLVAGAMKMYPLVSEAALAGLTGEELARTSEFVLDGNFWQFLAYCAGTGGSCLIIGSAAGVAAMGMERIPFMWYLKRISLLAVLGYLAGAAVYIAIHVM